MAVTSLLSHEVSDLCLGKPALRSLSISSTIADALTALKLTGENYLSVWTCNHCNNHTSKTSINDTCRCVGKICMVDVICYLCEDDNLLDPASALQSAVDVIISKTPDGVIRHVDSRSSLLDAIDLIIDGAQNLVIPIKNQRRKLVQKSNLGIPTTFHNGQEFCWITQEDVIRYLLNLIGLFSPIPAYSIESLGLISTDLHTVGYHEPAANALGAILDALNKQTSVAVVDDEGILIGEISPFTLSCCDETVTAAITTLSAGDLMAYMDCNEPPEDIVRVVKARLKERNLDGVLELLEEPKLSSSGSFSGSSSDEEFTVSSPTATLSSSNSRKYSRFGSYSAKTVRRAEAIVCHPRSSLVAVMVQALAHRANYVWVLEDDYSLVGIVTFTEMLKVFREHL